MTSTPPAASRSGSAQPLSPSQRANRPSHTPSGETQPSEKHRTPEDNDDDDDSTYHELVNALTQEILGFTNAQSKKRKRPAVDTVGDDEADQSSKSWKDFGRAYVRWGDLWTKVRVVVDHGIKAELTACELDDPDDDKDLDDDDDPDDDKDDDGNTNNANMENIGREHGQQGAHEGADNPARPKESPAMRARREHYDGSWVILCLTIPALRPVMMKLASKRRIRDLFCSQIAKGCNSARESDTSSLRKAIPSYLSLDKSLEPRLGPQDVHLRGWNNAKTASLLCPRQWRAINDTYDDIRAGRKIVKASQLPRFLWPDEVLAKDDELLDDEDIDLDDGFCRGHLLVRSAKHIYIAPTASLKPAGQQRGTKNGNAARMGMTCMTPRALAYIAVQARFSISSAANWERVDAKFNYEEFYWNLVDLLEGEDGHDIMEFYNRELWGAQASAAEVPGEENVEPPQGSIAQMQAQRAAKRARTE